MQQGRSTNTTVLCLHGPQSATCDKGKFYSAMVLSRELQ